MTNSTVVLRFSVLLSLVYFVTLAWQPYPGSAAMKCLSIATLAWLAWTQGSRLVALGLAVSSIGDLLLDIRGANLFVPGLAAFLLAHLIYTYRFIMGWPRPLRMGRVRLVLAGVTLLYSVLFTAWLAPSLGTLTIPVGFYICAITAMVISAIFAGRTSVILGALLFLVSDSLLAIAKFKGTFPLRDYLVWATYFAAQYAIATGMAGVAAAMTKMEIRR